MKKSVLFFFVLFAFAFSASSLMLPGCSKDDGTVNNPLVGSGWFYTGSNGFKYALYFDVFGECLMRSEQVSTGLTFEERHPYFVDGSSVTIRMSKNGQVLYSGTFTETEMRIVRKSNNEVTIYKRGAR